MYLTVTVVLIIFGAFLIWLGRRLKRFAQSIEEKRVREEYRKELLLSTLGEIRDVVVGSPKDHIEALLYDVEQLHRKQVVRRQIEELIDPMEVDHGEDNPEV